MAEINPPKYVKKVLKVLSSRGFTACIVGGCVRDIFLGVRPNDWDVSTGALPEEVMELFPENIPTGIRHGTVTVKIGSKRVEVTTFRTEGTYADHRHPDGVSFVGCLTEDLSRRDFTINAIAITADGAVIDPFGGREDIQAGIIRAVGDPDRRFEEDALRMFRAFRFSSRLGFGIEEKTFSAIKSHAQLTSFIAAERIRDEIEKILLTSHPEVLYTVIDCGLLDRFLKRHLSRDTALRCIASMKKRSVQRLAAFCTVLAADECVDSVWDFLRALKLDGRSLRCCADCTEIVSHPAPVTEKEWKILLRYYGVDSVECAAACWDAMYFNGHERMLKKVLKSGECFSLKHLAVNGHDLAKLGLYGRPLGEMLNFLLDYVIEFPENNDRDKLLSLASSSEE